MAVSFLLDRDLHFAANTGFSQAMREAGLRDFPRIHERATAIVWEFGNPLADDLARARHDGVATTPGLVMKSVWLLMQQPLTADEPEPFNRGQRRRLQRQDIPPGPVRSITPRRKAAPGHAHDTRSHREYHHQWVVKGHWRQQWYPSREVHAPSGSPRRSAAPRARRSWAATRYTPGPADQVESAIPTNDCVGYDESARVVSGDNP